MFWLGDKGRGTNTKGMGLMDYRIGGEYWRIWAQSRTFWLGSPSSGTVCWDSHQCLCSVQQRVLFCHPRAVPLVPKGPRRKSYYWDGGNTAEQATTLGSRALEEALTLFPLMVVLARVLRKWRPSWRDLGGNEILSNCKVKAGWKCWNNIRPGQQDVDQAVIWSSHSPPRLPSLESYLGLGCSAYFRCQSHLSFHLALLDNMANDPILQENSFHPRKMSYKKQHAFSP